MILGNVKRSVMRARRSSVVTECPECSLREAPCLVWTLLVNVHDYMPVFTQKIRTRNEASLPSVMGFPSTFF